MDFAASKNCINELLSRNCSYVIPKNQRKYVWDETEWAELFEDIFLIEQKNDYAHFIGSFVFAKTNANHTYEIIDGQQRLITISILFCCMSDILNEISEKKVSMSFLDSFVLGTNNGDDFYKITRDDESFSLIYLIDEIKKGIIMNFDEIESLFNDNFSKKDKYNRKIFNCYNYFKRRIKDYIANKNFKEELLAMKEKLISCQCIEITVGTDFEGFRVFETLNARGIPLEQHEIIKNYFYSYSRTKEKIKKLDSKWKEIVENTITEKSDYLSAFITHYCTHKYGKIKKSEEFRTIRDNTNKKEIDNLLNSIWKCSAYYSYIIDPEKYKIYANYSSEVFISLKFFHSMQIRQVRPVILSLFEAFKDKQIINEGDFIASLKWLESFYFAYVVLLKENTNKIDNTIASISKKICDRGCFFNALELIKSELKKYVSEEEKIKYEFKFIGCSNKNKKYKNSSNKRIANYVLEKIEKSLDEYGEINEVKISTIEHIYNDNENEDFSSYIGNLLPLSKRINNNASNKNFSGKINYYKQSNFLMTKEFVRNYMNQTSWGKEEIEKRSSYLAEYCFANIWKI